MAKAEDREALAFLHCAGFPMGDVANPVLGVFFSTYTPCKAGWWIDQTTTIQPGEVNEDGSYSYRVESTFANALTWDEVRGAGTYIIGKDGGTLSPIIEIVAPAGGSITDITSNLNFSWYSIDYEGQEMWYNPWGTLVPGQVLTVTYTVNVPAEAEAELTYYSQPLLTEYRLAE